MGSLKDEIKQFIGRYIRSISHLEAMLFLYKRKGHEFSYDAIASELRTNPEYAKQQLEELANSGLLRRCPKTADCYLYEGGSPDLDEVLQQIDSDYSRHRLAIIDLLYNQPLDKIKSFADAFKIKKD